jgi:purine-binding chemotaxis protein CheW
MVVKDKPGPSTGKTFEPELHLVVFKLGAEEYGVRIEQVKEVTVTPDIARMPRTPSFIKGVANIRGDIIAIMDLEERFGITPVPSVQFRKDPRTYSLVIESSDFTIGLIVQEVPQSLSIPVSQIDKSPHIIREKNIIENFIEGIGKVDDRLIIILDMHKILTTEEVEQLGSTGVAAGS